ncbi:MAG: tripartite tricarboxylate transporter substrate-binding protein [Pseudomonadota bacterium]|nr:tripartite tricarboxylate transporter substrate-binding protein [Pseudomonadota bacterium]
MRMSSFMRGIGAVGLSAILAVGALGVSAAKAVDFSGERITIIVPFNEGGGTDSYTRFMLPYFQKYLPGNPKIIVQNKPGAGGILGGNLFQQKAKADGTWLFALSTSTISNFALGDPRVKFKLDEFIPVILSPRGTMQYVRNDLGTQDISDLKGKIEKIKSFPKDKLVFGGKTPTSAGLSLRVGLSLLGIETKDVWGMKGNGPMALAFERGEFTINFDNTLSYKNNRKKLHADGTAVPLYTYGVINEEGEIVRDPVWPNVPTWREAYKAVHGKEPSGDGYDAFISLFHMTVTMSKSWNLPAGTPKDIVEAYRTAARKMMADPDFQSKRAKIFGPFEQTIGDAAIGIRNKATTIPPNARKWLAKYVKERYDITLE